MFSKNARFAGGGCWRLFAALVCLARPAGAMEAAGGASPSPALAARPNIIFILADDLGYGQLSCYGQKKYQTPNIDRLALEGMRFTQHYACPTCAPSRSALLTGLHPGHTPIRALGGFKTFYAEDVTVGEVLKSAGYATGIFGKWGLGFQDNPGHPNLHGFDEFFGQLHHIHAHFYYPYFLWQNQQRFMLPENEGRQQVRYAHDEIHRQALDFIRRHKDGPFFAYLAYTLPHIELAVPEDSERPFRGKWPKVAIPGLKEGYIGSDDSYATFAGMVSRLDRGVGEVMALLKELKLDDNTIVIFSSDNGPQAEQWKPVADFFEGAGPLRGYKTEFYEGGIRVPLIVRWPGHIRPGTESDLVSAFWDHLATLSELAGARPPANDGISMLPTLLGHPGKQRAHDFLYWEHPYGHLVQAVRMGDWKAITAKDGAGLELYNLKTDLAEQHNVAAERPDIVARIRQCLAQADRTPARNYPENPRPVVGDFVR